MRAIGASKLWPEGAGTGGHWWRSTDSVKGGRFSDPFISIVQAVHEAIPIEAGEGRVDVGEFSASIAQTILLYIIVAIQVEGEFTLSILRAHVEQVTVACGEDRKRI
jgi:hypothetical protein